MAIPSRGGRQSRGAHYTAPGIAKDVRQNARGNNPALPGRLWPQNVRPVIPIGSTTGPFAISSINYISPNATGSVIPDPNVPGDTALAHNLRENHTDTYPNTHIPFVADDNLFFGIKVPISHNEFYSPIGDAWLCKFQPGISAADRLTAQGLNNPLFKLDGLQLTATALTGNPNPDGGFEGGGTEFGPIVNVEVYAEAVTVDWDEKTLTWANQPPTLSTAKINFPSYPAQPGGPFVYYGEFGPGGFNQIFFDGFSTGAAPAQTVTTLDSRDNVNGDATVNPWQSRQFISFGIAPTIQGQVMLTPAPSTTSVALAGWPWAYGPDGFGPFFHSDPLYAQIIWESQYSLPGSPTTGPFIGARLTLLEYDKPGHPNPFTTTCVGFDGSGSGGIFYVDPANPFPFVPRVTTKVIDLPASPTDSTPTPTTVIDTANTDSIKVEFIVYGIAIRLFMLINGGFVTSVQGPTACDNKKFEAEYKCAAVTNIPNYPSKSVPLGSSPL